MRELLVLDHVHWDREWYRPHEQFRTGLLELVELILTELESGQRTVFHLDGQTITVADVLEIRPELEARISALVRSGRLTVGPWHVLADNQLVSGECLIRNLLIARRWGARLGALAEVGYSPDAFGHPADLPRILRGFGLETALVWRGAPVEHARFRWRSPDGSEVFAINQRYHEAEVLWDPATAADQLRSFMAHEQARHPNGPWVLMNGGDHLLPRQVAERTSQLAEAEVAARTVSVTELFALIRRADDHAELPVVEGDLRHPGDRLTFLLPGTLSARTYLKMANVRAQALLSDWVEPLEVLAPSVDGTGLLRHAWDLLVQNSPHDSACGCSVDAVHDQNAERAARVEQISHASIVRALDRLDLPVRGTARTHEGSTAVAVLNPHARPMSQGVQLNITTHPNQWPAALFAPDGSKVAFDAEDLGLDKAFEADLNVMPDTTEVRRHRIAFVATDVPARGHDVFALQLEPTPRRQEPTWADARRIEADAVTLEVADDATLSVVDGSITWTGLGRVEDRGDRGDTYNWDPLSNDAPRVPVVERCEVRRTEVKTEVRITATMDLPAGLTADRGDHSTERTTMPLTILVTQWSGVPGLKWRITVDNTVRDHRIAFHVPSRGAAKTWLADGLFSLVERPTGPVLGQLPREPGYESATGVAPVQTVAAIGDGAGRVAVQCAGLPEVQGIESDGQRMPELGVTLLRGVGWLSRFDLTTRTAGAGPQVETEGAQCRGRHVFDIGVRWGADVADDLDLALSGMQHRSPLKAMQVTGGSLRAGTSGPVLTVDDALVTAWKPAEDGAGSILRISNPTSTPRHARIGGGALRRLARSVEWCELDEARTGAEPCHEDGLHVELPPFAVQTLRLLR
ncbi:hypothetical protein BH11ACT1_BH11ACT1_08670 [soil metagenome]